MRTIVRFSIDGEKNRALGNKLTKVLVDSGFQYLDGTATYEGDLTPGTLGIALQSFWDKASTHVGPGTVDHFWMYSDKLKLGKQKKQAKAKDSTRNK